MKLITLSGVDGSGKSTQLTLLKEKLEQDGKKVFYFHAVEFSLANRLARLFKGKGEFVAGAEKASTQSSWYSLQLRKLFLLIDIFRFKSLLRKLEQEKYEHVLSDRYFYDSVINILYLNTCYCGQNKAPVFAREPKQSHPNNTGIATVGLFSSQQNSLPRKDTLWLERFIPKPDVAFYLQITAEEIMKRDRVPEQGIEYLRDKIKLFEQRKEAFGLIPVDASHNSPTICSTLHTLV